MDFEPFMPKQPTIGAKPINLGEPPSHNLWTGTSSLCICQLSPAWIPPRSDLGSDCREISEVNPTSRSHGPCKIYNRNVRQRMPYRNVAVPNSGRCQRYDGRDASGGLCRGPGAGDAAVRTAHEGRWAVRRYLFPTRSIGQSGSPWLSYSAITLAMVSLTSRTACSSRCNGSGGRGDETAA